MNKRLDCLLNSKQVAELVGLKYATLDRWLRPERGGILTCAEGAAGRGSSRRYTFLDVIRIQVLAHLRGEGVSMQMVRKVLNELSERYAVDDPLVQGRLVVAGTRLFWAVDDAMLLDVLRQQLAMKPLVILPLGEMIRETRAKVEAICEAA